MIIDKENVFVETSTAPAATGAIGDVLTYMCDNRNPMYLYLKAPLSSGTMTVALETSADNDSYSAIASVDLATTNKVVKMLLPLGVKKYLRLNATAVSSPAFTSGQKMLGCLVVDVDF